MCACQWTDLLLELELLTRIARLALTQKNYDLVYMHTYMYDTYMYVCMHLSTYVHIHTYMYMHAYMSTYTCGSSAVTLSASFGDIIVLL